ncbi:hypothetical protein BDF20DRAFT_798872, partial [Mycotypha africana]|uniref:uncharacterized protein n=1 Tax=Mycotypha africana TaxID=64632 RepID=UPI0023003F4D
KTYDYPPPTKPLMERRPSKIEVGKNKQPTYYSSDEDEDDEYKFDDEAILRDLNASKRIDIDDITLSDDDEYDTDDDTDGNINLSQQRHGCSRTANNNTATTMKNDLPPIPIISAPGYSDDEVTDHEENEPMPPIPAICAPGYSSDEEEGNKRSGGKEQQKTTTSNSILDSIFYGVRCGGCDKLLSGQAITTSGKHWHPRCFKCQACHQNLEHIAFYEKDGLPYCALDYHELFSPRCDYCKTPIEEHLISALGKTYHAGHFFCRECGKPFDEDTNFLEHEGHAYCEKDYFRRFGKRCKGCEEIITGDFLVALGGDWHKECFVCADCGSTFTSSTFLMRGGKPYCEEHYHQQENTTLRLKKKSSLPSISNRSTTKGTLRNLPDIDLLNSLKSLSVNDEDNHKQAQSEKKKCHRCREPIQGRCHTAFGFDYHPAHFQCSQCDKLLSPRLTGLYQEAEGGELICKPCARKSR